MDYYELNIENLHNYLSSLNDFATINKKSKIHISDISNGINSVFLISFLDKKNPSLILKQALPFFRMHRDEKLSQNRLISEIEAYKIYTKNTPDSLPKIYYTSEKMKVIVMEYLEDCLPLADLLKRQLIHPNFAKEIAYFLSNNFFKTSSLHLDSVQKRELITSFNQNSVICQLTENYVFSDRVSKLNSKKTTKNSLFDDLSFTNRQLQKNILELKYKFMTQSDSLIHSDFKPGAIFLNKNKLFIIDFEFSFVGPIGYDLGSFLYTIIAAIVSYSLYDGYEEYVLWLYSVIEDTFNSFEEELFRIWSRKESSALISTSSMDELVFKEYRDDFIIQILQDSIGFCAVQMSAMIIPLLEIHQYDYLKKEKYYYKIIYQISKVFLTKYKSIQNIATVVKIVKSLC